MDAFKDNPTARITGMVAFSQIKPVSDGPVYLTLTLEPYRCQRQAALSGEDSAVLIKSGNPDKREEVGRQK
jgi:hypothetical protein